MLYLHLSLTLLFSYGSPAADDSQDISDVTFTRENGINLLKFRKALRTGDDKVFNLHF